MRGYISPSSFLLLAGAAVVAQSSPPSVDLGYETHSATVNETGDYYIFSNVPYAEQPVGALRFQPVGLPTSNSNSSASTTVNNGSTDYMCYQAYPEWIVELEAAGYPGATLEEVEEVLYSQAGQTEACLMLDVYVPTGVFAGNSSEPAPVLLWIHGGGFTYGSKTSVGDPAGIIARSTLNDSQGVVFVSINYRLGMFGWLGGASFGLTPNLGLYDQRTAFDWVQTYIHLFGGDPSRVTVLGESAGATSILHHITSYGGNVTASQPPPAFAQGIIQSPAFQFNIDLDVSWNLTLAEASNLTATPITTAAELAALDISTLQAVNFDVVLSASEGLFNYGPTPDGTYVPELPQVLLAQGRFHSDIAVVAAHNSLEAAPFISTAISTDADLVALLATNFPELSNATVSYLLTTLYPSAAYGGSNYLRAVQIASDADFACATRYLALAKGNATYNYLFAYPPGYHAEDTSYTFFNGDTTTLDDGLPVDAALAYALQDYIVGFAMAGDPNASPAGPALEFPLYGENATVVEFASDGLVLSQDDDFNARCAWWQQAMIQGLV